VPRRVAAAEAGRPCRLPPGLGPSDPLAVASLLQVPGLEVVVDGYNVTRDDCGLAHGTLMEQRLWLVRLAGAVAARHRRRMTVVFDGTDLVPGAMPSTRGVLVAFSSGDETADDRIVALVDDLADDVPVLVVSSDRAVQRDCEARGANVAPSRSFLAAAGG
jgi:predicted RNA-binding protein with PIN domain